MCNQLSHDAQGFMTYTHCSEYTQERRKILVSMKQINFNIKSSTKEFKNGFKKLRELESTHCPVQYVGFRN